MKWAGWEILRVKEVTSAGENQVDLRIDVDSPATKYKESAESEVVTLDGGKATYKATLTPQADSWLIAELVELAQ